MRLEFSSDTNFRQFKTDVELADLLNEVDWGDGDAVVDSSEADVLDIARRYGAVIEDADDEDTED